MTDECPLDLRVATSRSVMSRQGGRLYVSVSAAPPPPTEGPRMPVALALVVDHSGSMSEPATPPILARPHRPAPFWHGQVAASKLEFVKRAAEQLIASMHDGDAIALIGFASTVTVLKPLTVLERKSRDEITHALLHLWAEGNTYLEGALAAGFGELAGEPARRYSSKVVLLSDGQANLGLTDPRALADRAASCAAAGVTVSTLGVGVDYNSALMGALADSGNGDFHHIGAPDGVERVLAEEFAAASFVTARAVEVELVVQDDLAVGSNLNGYPHIDTLGGASAKLGDLVRTKEVVFELSSPVPLRGEQLAIRATARYRNQRGAEMSADSEVRVGIVSPEAAAAAPEDEALLAQVAELLRARAVSEATAWYEAGMPLEALSRLAGGQADLDQLANCCTVAPGVLGIERLTTGLAELGARMQSGGLTRSAAKVAFAASHSLQRNRTLPAVE